MDAGGAGLPFGKVPRQAQDSCMRYARHAQPAPPARRMKAWQKRGDTNLCHHIHRHALEWRQRSACTTCTTLWAPGRAAAHRQGLPGLTHVPMGTQRTSHRVEVRSPASNEYKRWSQADTTEMTSEASVASPAYSASTSGCRYVCTISSVASGATDGSRRASVAACRHSLSSCRYFASSALQQRSWLLGSHARWSLPAVCPATPRYEHACR